MTDHQLALLREHLQRLQQTLDEILKLLVERRRASKP